LNSQQERKTMAVQRLALRTTTQSRLAPVEQKSKRGRIASRLVDSRHSIFRANGIKVVLEFAAGEKNDGGTAIHPSHDDTIAPRARRAEVEKGKNRQSIG
jgi:hypothetical protein